MMKEVYLAPIEHYDPNMIIVLLSNRKDEQSLLENEIYLSAKDKIQCNKITEYSLDTHNFDAIAGTLIEIKKNLRRSIKDDLDIFINISSGTNEYAAAGMFAAMTPPTDIAFNVIIEDNGLSRDEMNAFFRDREHTISKPSVMTQIDKADPDEEFVALLTILKQMLSASKYTKYSSIIDALKEHGAWSYCPEKKSSSMRTDLRTKEEMYLKRHYLDIAIRNGWIEKNSSSRLSITAKGESYLAVCREKEMSSMVFCCAEPTDEYRSCNMASVRKRKGKDALVVEHNGKSYRFTLSMK